ncbi:DUF488 domain-containing protein [Streptomyces violascens]|uniref:DUF488 family protein n=1 Tax=Streptomyces violascens TaxID=67381 RepID=A0ABQ3QGM3_9ACTN|nr:DUF488 family protein [Streptomyces violascens]GGT89939.1 hypothetical protein GCM10010289_07550 [Streptomyces violascens]GHI36420.1 hypothetical protein Sviol_08280 [Streptomyces violascens]
MPGKRTMRVRRVYDPPEDGDGVRVLVDRLWPRGLSKERAAVDEWPKELTPSTELRRWYHEDRTRYAEFRERYEAELAEPGPARALDRLLGLAKSDTVTLVTAVKDIDHSHVPTLVAALERGRPSG